MQGVVDVIPFYSKGINIVSGSGTIQGSLQGVDPNQLFKLYKGLDLIANY